LTWPDHGAPDQQDYVIISKILDYISEFHEKAIENDNKIVLHCSAGIGRTGSLIAIYNLQLTALTLSEQFSKSK